MASFDVPTDANHQPTCQLVEALSGRRIQVTETPHKAHPFRSLAIKSAALNKSLEELLDELDKLEKVVFIPKADAENETPRKLTNLAYSAAELFEVYDKLPNQINLRPTKAFKESAALYRSSVDRASRDWALLCNSLKHYANALQSVNYRFVRSGARVHGFRLVEPVPNATLTLNTKYHQAGEREKSYNAVLRDLIYSIMRCDTVAAKTVGSLPEQDCEPISERNYSFPFGPAIARISKTPLLVFPSEGAAFNGFTINRQILALHRMRGYSPHEDAEVSMTQPGDGFTKSFPYR